MQLSSPCHECDLWHSTLGAAVPRGAEVETKTQIRRSCLERRAGLPASRHACLSRQAQQRLADLALFRQAQTLALYCPIRAELDTRWLLQQAREAGLRVGLPRVQGDQLHFLRCDNPATLCPGCFGVPEPMAGELLLPEQFDVVVVPGVAFDRRGGRLGYGKGFYDRFLCQCRPDAMRIGLGFSFQLLPQLPCEPHDVTLQALVTEKEVLFSHAPPAVGEGADLQPVTDI